MDRPSTNNNQNLTFPWTNNSSTSTSTTTTTTAIQPVDLLKLANQDDDDDSEEDFILLQIPLVPKKFTVKQEIKIEEYDDLDVEYLYPEEGEIIEEDELIVPVENSVDNSEDFQQEQQQELQEDASTRDYEKQKAEFEQKIRDIKEYYSIISSMCLKLDAFIKAVDGKLALATQLNMKCEKIIRINKPTDHLANSKCSGWTHVFGTPYFKDKQFFSAPKNYDVVLKEQRHEINVSSLSNPHLWKPYEKQKMAQTIKKFEIQKRINSCIRRSKELVADLHNFDEDKRREVEDELSDLKDRQSLIKKLSLAELVHGKFDEYDWLKISVTDLGNQHSPEECRSMWFAYLHPDITKGEWSEEEKTVLQDLAEKHNYQNWSLVAEQLGTGRSPYQCIRFYQTQLNDQLIRKKWTEDEDRLVQQMVEKCRVGTFIPWARVAVNIEGRTKVQVFNRWKYCLEPSIRKGRFTEEEDLMILAAMRWYGRNFQQISRFIPGRTPIQLRDRYNTSLENDHKISWDTACDEKLVEMVEEFGTTAWSFISQSFPGFSRVQIRHRYYVIEKWRETNDPESFPPIRRHTAKRNYDNRLDDVLGSYVDITEDRAAIIGDKPLFQIQNKLGLQHRKKRGRPKYRAKRTKYSTALDILFLKHFSVSYHCHHSTSKRIVNKEVLEEDGKLLKSLLTIFNAALSIPEREEAIKMYSELRNQEDECLLKYLKHGSVTRKQTHEHQERCESLTDTTIAVTEAAMTTTEVVTTATEVITPAIEVVRPATKVAVTARKVTATEMLTSLLPKKCSYTLATYVTNNENNSNLQQNKGSKSYSAQKRLLAEPMEVCSAVSSANYKYKKSSAATSLSSLLPQKCSYTLAESFMSNAAQRKSNSSLIAGRSLQNGSVSLPAPGHSLHVDADFNDSSDCAVVETSRRNANHSFSVIEDNRVETGDSSVPIDNGITIRWCLIPNYATLICCKTLLLCSAPLTRTIEKSKKWKKAEKLRQEDKASTKQTLENIIKSDDPLALQEMLTEFDVDTSKSNLSEKSSFTYAEADALCKQRFVSLLLFPALVSIRNLKVCDDVFELSKDDRQCKSRTEEEQGPEKVDSRIPVYRNVDELTVNYFKNIRKSTFKENIPETNGNGQDGKVKKKRGRKRKSEIVPVEDGDVAQPQTSAVTKKKYSRRSPGTQTRKSGRPHKPVQRDPHHVYNY